MNGSYAHVILQHLNFVQFSSLPIELVFFSCRCQKPHPHDLPPPSLNVLLCQSDIKTILLCIYKHNT